MPRRNVNIGGAELDAVVAGDGPVTVIFENGLATPLEIWQAVVPPVAAVARTIRYDRRWAPLSGPLPRRSPSEIVGDLEKLLHALDARPPYVLVGHSWGGALIRLFAHAHPSEVAGLVFVDATHESLDPRVLALMPAMNATLSLLCRAPVVRRALLRQLCPPSSLPAYRARMEERLLDPARWPIGLRTIRAESPAIPVGLAQLRRDCPDLPPIPVHVLTAGAVSRKSARRVYDAWKEAAARAANARYTHVANSSHYMPVDAPGVVVDAILGVLAAVPA